MITEKIQKSFVGKNVMELTVQTVWKGKVAIREKYYTEAVAKGCAIRIHCKGKEMTIIPDLIKAYIFKSAQPFKSKFDAEAHYLIYYKWRPDGEDEPAKNVTIKKVKEKEIIKEQASLF